MPRRFPRSLLISLVAVSTACSTGTESAAPAPSTSRAAQAPGRLAPVPPPGTVTVVPGPFTDRIELDRIRLVGRTVEARVRVTSDVSELIDLELTATFYDDRGRLLGSGRTVYQEGDGGTGAPDAERNGVELTVRLPGSGPAPASARLAVPVLVNE